MLGICVRRRILWTRKWTVNFSRTLASSAESSQLSKHMILRESHSREGEKQVKKQTKVTKVKAEKMFQPPDRYASMKPWVFLICRCYRRLFAQRKTFGHYAFPTRSSGTFSPPADMYTISQSCVFVHDFTATNFLRYIPITINLLFNFCYLPIAESSAIDPMGLLK